MNRRKAGIALLLGPLVIGAAPLAADAQPAGKVCRIGYLSAPTRQSVERALELVRLNVDLIVAPAASAALAAKKATSSIPIVMMFPSDPVGSGVVADLRRPGGNVTGTTSTPNPENPSATRVAFLMQFELVLNLKTAKALGLTLPPSLLQARTT